MYSKTNSLAIAIPRKARKCVCPDCTLLEQEVSCKKHEFDLLQDCQTGSWDKWNPRGIVPAAGNKMNKIEYDAEAMM